MPLIQFTHKEVWLLLEALDEAITYAEDRCADDNPKYQQLKELHRRLSTDRAATIDLISCVDHPIKLHNEQILKPCRLMTVSVKDYYETHKVFYQQLRDKKLLIPYEQYRQEDR